MNTEQENEEQVRYLQEYFRKKEEKRRAREVRRELRRRNIYTFLHGIKRNKKQKEGNVRATETDQE